MLSTVIFINKILINAINCEPVVPPLLAVVELLPLQTQPLQHPSVINVLHFEKRNIFYKWNEQISFYSVSTDIRRHMLNSFRCFESTPIVLEDLRNFVNSTTKSREYCSKHQKPFNIRCSNKYDQTSMYGKGTHYCCWCSG